MSTSLGCESFRHRRAPAPPPQEIQVEEVQDRPKITLKTPEFVNKTAPKLGLILSSGGALTYAQIGFLRELEKQKIPVHAVAGLEWGALVAATYAHEGTAHGVEWKLLKLPFEKFEQSGFFSRGPKAALIGDFDKSLQSVFTEKQVNKGSIPFACAYADLKKGATELASAATYLDRLKQCWPYPPHFQVNKVGAQPMAIATMARALRNQGAEKVIYVDVVSKHRLKVDDSLSQLLWNSVPHASREGVDDVFYLIISGHSLQSYGSVRALVRSGETKSHNFVKELSRKYAY